MNWAFAGGSTVADKYLVNAVRAETGSNVDWAVSVSDQRADSDVKDGGFVQIGTELTAALAYPSVGAVFTSSTNDVHFAQALAAAVTGKTGSAPCGRDRVKFLQTAYAVHTVALSDLSLIKTYGELT